MKPLRKASVLTLAAALLAALAMAQAPAARSDLNTPEARRPSVDLAMKIARQGETPKLAADLKSPFYPPEFEQVAGGTAAPAAPGQAAAGTAAVAPRQSGARTVLTQAESAIRASVVGPITFRGVTQLQLRAANGRTQNIGIGQSFNVTIEGQPHAIELEAIDGNSYTLRYQNERLTLSTSQKK